MIIRYLNENKVFGNYKNKSSIDSKEERKKKALSMANDVYNKDIEEKLLDILYEMKTDDASFANIESFIIINSYHFSVTPYAFHPKRGSNCSNVNYEIRNIRDFDKGNVHYKEVSIDIPVMLYRSWFLEEGEKEFEKYTGESLMEVLDNLSKRVEIYKSTKALAKEYSCKIIIKTKLKLVESLSEDDLPLSLFNVKGTLFISPRCDNVDSYYKKLEKLFECFSEFTQRVYTLSINYDKPFEFDKFIIGNAKANKQFEDIICTRFRPANLAISKFSPKALEELPDLDKILVPHNDNKVIIKPPFLLRQNILDKLTLSICGKKYRELVNTAVEDIPWYEKDSKKSRFASNRVWRDCRDEATEIIHDPSYWEIESLTIHLDTNEYEVVPDISYQRVSDAFTLLLHGKKRTKRQ